MTRVAVVDHGAGNLVSIEQALRAAGAEVTMARQPRALAGADALVLPGVGAAGPAMARLVRRGFADPIRAWIADDRPFLGICLGLQLLFDGSDEDDSQTLGVLSGRTVRLEGAPRLPHIGWNEVHRRRPHPLFDGIPPDAPFYFVHSFVVAPAPTVPAAGAPVAEGPPVAEGECFADGAPAAATSDPPVEPLVLATAEHGRPFVAAVARGRLMGVQFHPERSGADGLRLIARFAAMADGAAGRAA